MMRKLSAFVLTITLLALAAACGNGRPDTPASETTVTPSASVLGAPTPGGQASAAPASKPAPVVISPEELLSAAEATSLVGQAVTASFDAAEVSETGETWGSYTYDIPWEGTTAKDTIFASICLIQDSLISPSELKKGHDAEWSFEEFQTYIPEKIIELPGLGKKAFYVKDNSEVHVLFQDYYILIAFIKDTSNLEATLALNKSIADFVIGKLSLTDLTLTSP
jgi:hypothetical protein